MLQEHMMSAWIKCSCHWTAINKSICVGIQQNESSYDALTSSKALKIEKCVRVKMQILMNSLENCSISKNTYKFQLFYIFFFIINFELFLG